MYVCACMFICLSMQACCCMYAYACLCAVYTCYMCIINKYIIYREAVILTIDEKGFYESNTFNGIQIRRIGIDTSNEIKDFFEQYNLLDDNELSALYESRINQKQGLSQIKQQMKKDEIKVTKLYGKNGSL